MAIYSHLYDTKRDRYIKDAMNYTVAELKEMRAEKKRLEVQGLDIEIMQSKDILIAK